MPNVGQSLHSTENFDRIASEAYDESIPHHVMEHLTLRRASFIRGSSFSGRVLDVGCGTGRLLSHLPSAEYERFGIDISLGMVQQAIQRDSLLQCMRGSATELPFPDDTFDVVFCAAVLHHLAHKEAVRNAIQEIVRVTRSGGTAIIWDHNPRNPYWPWLMARVPQDIGEERLIPMVEIREALQQLPSLSMAKVSCHQITFIPDFAPVWALPVLTFAERICEATPIIRNISAHNVVVVKKG